MTPRALAVALAAIMTDPEVRSNSLAATGRAALVLTGGAVIVQVIGFARQLFLAAEIGITSGLDALLIGLAMPLALVGVFTAGIRPAVVPAYVAAMDERGATAAKQLVGTVLFWMGLVGLVISLAIWVFADAIVAVTGPGLADAGSAEDAVRFLRMLAPLAFVGTVSSVYLALCQAETLFPPIALATVAGPFLALAIMVFYWDTLALDGLVIGTLVGSVVSLSIVVVATIMRRIAPMPRLRVRGLGLRDLGHHAAPLTLSAAILQISLMVDRAIASLLLAGGVSALRFGESLVRIPFGAIRPAYGTAIYPTLVRVSRGPDKTGLATATERVLRYALVFFVPLAGLTIAVAPVATATAYDRGSFSGADLALTAQVVAVSAPLIVTWTVAPTLVSALNARRKGTVLLAAGVLNVSINLVLNVVLGYLLGVVGVAIATTVVSVVVVAFLSRMLVRFEPTFSLRLVWRTFLKACLAILPGALVFGVPIWAGVINGDLAQRVVILVTVGVAGLTSYYGIARRLGLEEAGSIVAFGKDTLRRILRRAHIMV